MSIPAGTYYVAEQVPNETVDARQNAAIGILTNNVWIRGAGKTNTTLIAYDRNTTILYLGASFIVPQAAVTNFVLSDITLQARPHIVATNDVATGGFTNHSELGALDPLLIPSRNGSAQNGCLLLA